MQRRLPEGGSRSSWPAFAIPLALFAIALLIRLLYLNKTLDHDEMATAVWAMARSPVEALRELWAPWEGNAAGYPVFIWLWGRAGLSEPWLRLPSALASAGTAALLYAYGTRTFSRTAAGLAALLWSLSTLSVFEGQYARVYSLYGLLCLLNLACYQRWSAAPSPRRGAAFLVTAIAALYSHYFAALYLAPLFVAWAHRAWRERKRDLLWPAAAVSLVLPQAPLLLHQLANGPRWIQAPTLAGTLSELVRLFWLSSGPPTALLAGTFAVGVAVSRHRLKLEAAWTLFPLAAGLALSVLVRPVFVAPYFFPSGPGLFLFVAGGFDFLVRSSRRNARLALSLGGLIALAASAGLPEIYAAPKATDWRGATGFIQAHVKDCGRVIVTAPFRVKSWPYYLGPGFEYRPWNEGFPKGNFWLAGVGHPGMPDEDRVIGEKISDLKWRGAEAFVYCLRPEVSDAPEIQKSP